MRRADHGVRIAFGAEVGDGAGILAAAFAQDPWFGWLYPQVEERAAMSEAWFELVLGRALSMGHSYRTAAGFVNWVPPDVHFPGPADIELLSADKCFLHRGALTAHVPPPAVGFIGT